MTYNSMTTRQLEALITQRCIPEMNERQKFIAMLTLDDHRRILYNLAADVYDIRESLNNIDIPTSRYCVAMKDVEDTLTELYSATAEVVGIK
jgi:hypothetical protein